MNAPDKIWITTDLNGYYMSNHPSCGEEYIRKDALLEKINGQIRICEELKAEGRDDVFYTAEIDAFEQTKRIIESL